MCSFLARVFCFNTCLVFCFSTCVLNNTCVLLYHVYSALAGVFCFSTCVLNNTCVLLYHVCSVLSRVYQKTRVFCFSTCVEIKHVCSALTRVYRLSTCSALTCVLHWHVFCFSTCSALARVYQIKRVFCFNRRSTDLHILCNLVCKFKKNMFTFFSEIKLKQFFSTFFWKIEITICSAAMPHPARQCACASRCCAC